MTGRDWLIVVGVAVAGFLVLRCIRGFGDDDAVSVRPRRRRDGGDEAAELLAARYRRSVGSDRERTDREAEALLRRALGDPPP